MLVRNIPEQAEKAAGSAEFGRDYEAGPSEDGKNPAAQVEQAASRTGTGAARNQLIACRCNNIRQYMSY